MNDGDFELSDDSSFQDTSSAELVIELDEVEMSLAKIEWCLRTHTDDAVLVNVLRYEPGIKCLRTLLHLVLHERANWN